MKALVGAFNQEKALVGAFSVIVKTGCGTDGALHSTIQDAVGEPRGAGGARPPVPDDRAAEELSTARRLTTAEPQWT